MIKKQIQINNSHILTILYLKKIPTDCHIFQHQEAINRRSSETFARQDSILFDEHER